MEQNANFFFHRYKCHLISLRTKAPARLLFMIHNYNKILHSIFIIVQTHILKGALPHQHMKKPEIHHSFFFFFFWVDK